MLIPHLTDRLQLRSSLLIPYLFSLDKALENKPTHRFSPACSFHECGDSHRSRADGESHPPVHCGFTQMSVCSLCVWLYLERVPVEQGGDSLPCVKDRDASTMSRFPVTGCCSLSVSAELSPACIYRRPSKKSQTATKERDQNKQQKAEFKQLDSRRNVSRMSGAGAVP